MWPEPSPALWEVTAPEGQKAWLFGTIHSLPDGVEWRTELLDQALADAGMLVVELSTEELDTASDIYAELDDTNGLPPLLERFEGAERNRVSQLLAHVAVDRRALDANETWSAALILSAEARVGDPANGVDRALITQSSNVLGLETARQQLSFFDRLPAAEQEDLLLAVADGVLSDQSEDGIAAWVAGELEALESLSSASILADPELRETLQAGRNRAWMSPIMQSIRSGDQPFVAVGAAHMLGPDGIPALLKAEGFTVTRIQ